MLPNAMYALKAQQTHDVTATTARINELVTFARQAENRGVMNDVCRLARDMLGIPAVDTEFLATATPPAAVALAGRASRSVGGGYAANARVIDYPNACRILQRIGAMSGQLHTLYNGAEAARKFGFNADAIEYAVFGRTVEHLVASADATCIGVISNMTDAGPVIRVDV
jgi:hypothetical protein